jgi:hypothetical protein
VQKKFKNAKKKSIPDGFGTTSEAPISTKFVWSFVRAGCVKTAARFVNAIDEFMSWNLCELNIKKRKTRKKRDGKNFLECNKI